MALPCCPDLGAAQGARIQSACCLGLVSIWCLKCYACLSRLWRAHLARALAKERVFLTQALCCLSSLGFSSVTWWPLVWSKTLANPQEGGSGRG